jgi:cell division protein FtsI (penicillin-binding protein 3)
VNRSVRRNANRHSNPLLRLDLQRWRMRLVMSLIFCGFGVLSVRAAYLQVIDTEFLNDQGEKRVNRVIPIPAHRGMLLDRRGEPLAISTPVESIWINPKEAIAPPTPDSKGQPSTKPEQQPISPAQIQALAECLKSEPETVRATLADPRKTFVYLRRMADPRMARECVDLKIKGVHASPEFRRFYPAGEVMAHALGITNLEDRGLEGLEIAYNNWLAGDPGARRVIKDRKGNVVQELDLLRLPKPGNDLSLAFNAQIQYLAYRELLEAVLENKAKAGSVVVLDARTGEVLAMANAPSYNPNNRATMNPERVRNRAVTDVFEPGSTMKPFLMAAALDARVVEPDTAIDTGPGWFYIGDKRISDVHPKGVLSLPEALQVSSNVVAAKIALEMRAEDYWRLLSRSGFGSPPASGLPGEVAGRLRPYHTWRPIEKATMAFGHGLSVSLLQLARAYTAFANDGVLVPLTVLKRNEGVIGKRVMSEATARQLRAMLELVTQDEGTAPQARVMGYRVAGKTGTAHKLEDGRYTNKYIASFVGLAPASNPRLVVAVMVDEPTAKYYYGGLVAAPVFSRIMAGALRLMAIPPDAPLDASSTPGFSDHITAEAT